MMRAFVDLHCHTRGSFDSLSAPADVVRAAAIAGLTHLAITDHDRIDGALEARAIGARRADGDRRRGGQDAPTATSSACSSSGPIPPGLSAVETIAAAREQGGLVGIPHPFDRFRGSICCKDAVDGAASSPLVDWVEGHNARIVGNGNEHAPARSRASTGCPASRSPTPTRHGGRRRVHRRSTATRRRRPGLLAALADGASSCPGGRRYFVRLWTPSPRSSSGCAATAGSSRAATDGTDRRTGR